MGLSAPFGEFARPVVDGPYFRRGIAIVAIKVDPRATVMWISSRSDFGVVGKASSWRRPFLKWLAASW